MKESVATVHWPKTNFPVRVRLFTDEEAAALLLKYSVAAHAMCHMEYQDILFLECLVEIDAVLKFMAELSKFQGRPDFLKGLEARNELEDIILSCNPILDPDSIIVDGYGKLRFAGLAPGMSLSRGVNWHKVVEDNNPYLNDKYFEPSTSNGGTMSNGEEIVKMYWPAMSVRLEIRKLSKEEIPSFFEDKHEFKEEILYKTYVASRCLTGYDSVLQLAELSGLTAEKGGAEIIEELYGFCVEVNPFLKYEQINLENIPPVPSKKKRPTARPQAKPEQAPAKKGFDTLSREDFLSLGDRMKAKVIGQDEQVDKIVEMIQIAGSGLRDKDKPVASFLLVGPTGTGKTLVSKVLAEELTGSADNLIRIDCTEYGQSHDVQKLIGAPPSYIGYDDGGYLTKAVNEKPFSVILFDEIEKAHKRLYDILLQILDDARLTDGKGKVSKFNDCIIIMTSNIGVGEVKAIERSIGFGDVSNVTESKRNVALYKALKTHFRPEFLNRLDGILTFAPLDRDTVHKIIGLTLEKLFPRLKDQGIEAEISPELVDALYAEGYSAEYNARPLHRAVNKHVLQPLSHKLLKEEIKSGNKVILGWDNGKLAVKLK